MTQISSRPLSGAAATAFGTSAAAVSGPKWLDDGISGRRVPVPLHDNVSHHRPPSVRTQLTTMLNGVDDIYNTSAAQLGGTRFVRWVTDAVGGGCQASIVPVSMTSATMSTFGTMTNALQALGYNRADRTYLTFALNSTFCGIGSVQPDSSPGAANASNGMTPEYARVDNGQGCWSATTAAHEIGHTLGAAQLDAPHTTGGWHCSDENDIICYSDAPGVVMSQVLVSLRRRRLFLRGLFLRRLSPRRIRPAAPHRAVSRAARRMGQRRSPDPSSLRRIGDLLLLTAVQFGWSGAGVRYVGRGVELVVKVTDLVGGDGVRLVPGLVR